VFGCAGSPPANEPKSAGAPVAPSARPSEGAPLVPTESDPTLLSGTPRRRARFARSPITELGEKIVELVTAAIDGKPLPNDLPLGTPRRDTGPVQLTGLDLDDAKGIDWFGLGIEVDFSVTTQGGTPANVDTVYLLTEAGLHLIGTSVGERERKLALPRWARGLETVAIDLLATARRGNLASLLPGDDVRRVFAADEFWEKAVKTLPKAEKLDELEALARTATSGPTGFRLDDVELVGRKPDGKLYTAKLDFDEGDGSVILEPHVHVRVVTLPKEEAEP
jgi:hypothetical protein